MSFPTPAAFDAFKAKWDRQTVELSYVRVLAQLIEELGADQQRVADRLLNEYGIQSDRQYRYDVSQSTILEISPDRPADQPRIHRKLTSEESRREFVALLTRKESLRQQLVGLNLLIRDKREALETVRSQLLREYSISRDREYEIDSETRAVWELIPQPSFSGASSLKVGQSSNERK